MLNLRRSVRLARTKEGKGLPWEKLEVLEIVHIYTGSRTGGGDKLEYDVWAIADNEFVIIPYDELKLQIQQKKWELYTGLTPNR